MRFDGRDADSARTQLWPDLGIGLGLRSPHYAHVLKGEVKVDWFEATPENYFGLSSTTLGGRPIRILEKIRERFPIVLHGVSLSIGSTDELDRDYLKRLRALSDRIQPAWVSDHICWTGVEGQNLHDLLPLPFTDEAITHVVERIGRVQDMLGRRMLFENVSSYLSYAHSEMTEWEFVSEIAKRSDCGILLDVNNIFVSAINHGFDPIAYIEGLPAERIGQIHLAGHTEHEGLLIDTHDQPVREEVWDLYRETVRRLGPVSTMIERDGNIPEYERVEAEALRAADIRERVTAEGANAKSRFETREAVRP